jgi:hypothetical protein
MKTVNLYWSVYRNLEKEIMQLANEIHFDDSQIKVYSIKIVDLIFRCSAEIESISKDIYRDEIKKEPKNAGECINYFETNWLLNKKQVVMSAISFYFQKEFIPSFAPFDYIKNDENDYYSAYNAIKHDRVKNIKKANVNILIRAMAALYLLNIYYRKDKFTVKSEGDIPFNFDNSLGSDIPSNFDNSLGSDIFSVKIGHTHYDQINGDNSVSRGEHARTCVFLTRYPQDIYERIKKKQEEVLRKQNELISTSREFKEFEKAGNKLEPDEVILSAAHLIGTWYYKKQIMKLPTKEEQLKAIYRSSEYKRFSQNNAKQLEGINKDDVEALCNCFGCWDYVDRVVFPQRELVNIYLNSNLNIVLNKNQVI